MSLADVLQIIVNIFPSDRERLLLPCSRLCRDTWDLTLVNFPDLTSVEKAFLCSDHFWIVTSEIPGPESPIWKDLIRLMSHNGKIVAPWIAENFDLVTKPKSTFTPDKFELFLEIGHHCLIWDNARVLKVMLHLMHLLDLMKFIHFNGRGCSVILPGLCPELDTWALAQIKSVPLQCMKIITQSTYDFSKIAWNRFWKPNGWHVYNFYIQLFDLVHRLVPNYQVFQELDDYRNKIIFYDCHYPRFARRLGWLMSNAPDAYLLKSLVSENIDPDELRYILHAFEERLAGVYPTDAHVSVGRFLQAKLGEPIHWRHLSLRLEVNRALLDRKRNYTGKLFGRYLWSPEDKILLSDLLRYCTYYPYLFSQFDDYLRQGRFDEAKQLWLHIKGLKRTLHRAHLKTTWIKGSSWWDFFREAHINPFTDEQWQRLLKQYPRYQRLHLLYKEFLLYN